MTQATNKILNTIASGYRVELSRKRRVQFRVNALRLTKGERSQECNNGKDRGEKGEQRPEANTPSIKPVTRRCVPSSTVGKCVC